MCDPYKTEARTNCPKANAPGLIGPGALWIRTNCLTELTGYECYESVTGLPSPRSKLIGVDRRHQKGGPWARLSGSIANGWTPAAGRCAFRTEAMISGSPPEGMGPDLAWRLNIMVPASITLGPELGALLTHLSARHNSVRAGANDRLPAPGRSCGACRVLFAASIDAHLRGADSAQPRMSRESKHLGPINRPIRADIALSSLNSTGRP